MEAARGAFAELAISTAQQGPSGDVLVSIFLRGGADGLNLAPPHADDDYYKARPSLGIAAPDDRSAGEERAIDLDGFFGLHPRLKPLDRLYQAGQLAVVHAVGSEDQTRSHFEAQDLMEMACPVDQKLGSGWLARHLRTCRGQHSPLSAVAIAEMLPEALRGSPGASAVRSVDDFAIHREGKQLEPFTAALGRLYQDAGGELGRAGDQLLETLETVERLRSEATAREGAGNYPQGQFGDGLRQVARLIKAEVGLEVACVDIGGWDTHFVQGATGGLFGSLAAELGESLAAFWDDVRQFQDRVTVVTMTEFGRRLHENVSLGTDHGRGSVMFVLGGGIHGGQVVADWPGLGADDLEGPGDLRVTTDYRDILGEIVSNRLRNDRAAEVFPGHTLREHGLVRQSG